MRRFALLSLALILAPLAARADDSTILARWTQFVPGGAVETRAAVSGTACPAPMQPRADASADFPLLCAAPATALKHTPERILVLGDTGCRIKGSLVQPCNDPVQWPFAALAQSAARFKPDLVIHVGDYLYRETPCPAGNAGCTGTPYGDNWATWKADFFDPAAPLLAAAPWVVVRGNHEDCYRSGPGFLRLLGSGAYDASAPCADHVASYSIPFDGLNFVVMDNASAQDTSVDPSAVPVYQSEFAGLANTPEPTWLLMHRPIWGAVSGPMGLPVGGNQTMLAALGNTTLPKPVTLQLAGHIHVFEALNYNDAEPPAMLSGNGGDLLDTAPADLAATVFGTAIHVKAGVSQPGFGFLMMTKVGRDWNVDLYDASGTFTRRCLFADRRIDCPN
jgi:hypothetical protein